MQHARHHKRRAHVQPNPMQASTRAHTHTHTQRTDGLCRTAVNDRWRPPGPKTAAVAIRDCALAAPCRTHYAMQPDNSSHTRCCEWCYRRTNTPGHGTINTTTVSYLQRKLKAAVQCRGTHMLPSTPNISSSTHACTGTPAHSSNVTISVTAVQAHALLQQTHSAVMMQPTLHNLTAVRKPVHPAPPQRNIYAGWR